MQNDTPIVKAFIKDNKYYVYDTNMDIILELDKALYHDVIKMIKNGITSYMKDPHGMQKEKILNLMNQGFFKSYIVEKIVHFENKYVNNLTNRYMGYLQLQVTCDCNFSCRYCFYANDNKIERNHKNDYMTWEIAKKSIDFFFEHSKDNNEVSFSFYGGEPLLNYNLIKRAVLYIETLFYTKKINYFITTNASLITKDIIDFFIKHQFNLTISEDGPESIQNHHRKFRYNGADTFNVVFQNIMKIKKANEKYFKEKVMFNPVMFANESRESLLVFFASIGVSENAIRNQYADVSGIDYLYSGNLKNNSRNNINEYVDLYRNTQIKNYTSNIKKKTMLASEWHPNGVCVPSVSKIFVTVNGDLYPCEKCLELSSLQIGTLDNGLNIDKIVAMSNIGQLTETQCKRCWAIRFCNICAIHCVDVEKDFLCSQAKLNNCEKQKNIIEKYIRTIV